MHSYDFGERLRMSHGHSANASVQSVLLRNIPSACRVVRASESDDKHGIDWWVECVSQRSVSVDCKVRSRDYAADGKDDLALETFSVIEAGLVGWTRDRSKQTDYVLWLWQDTGRWLLVPFQLLCGVFEKNWQDWASEYQTARQRSSGYGKTWQSECVFVPRRIIWAAIYLKYGGTPRNETEA